MADPIVRVVRDYGERARQLGRGSTPTARCISPIGRCRARSAGGARRARRLRSASRAPRADGAARDRRAARLPRRPYQAIDIVEPGRARNALEHRHDAQRAGALPARACNPGIATTCVLDGQRRNVNTTSPRVTLPDVFRGTHTLQVVVIDSAGAEVMRSPSANLLRAANERAESELGDRPAAAGAN